jgi:Zn-dependent peptidase ImmA (M78 family)/transcriptional regulator with XRE-family HTH domain
MAMKAQKRSEIPFNEKVLKWARERYGRSLDEAAKRVGVTPEKVKAWEDGEANPTVRQARILAAEYERPFLEFFSKTIPSVSEPTLIPDFRVHYDSAPSHEPFEIKQIQSWAETQRLNTLDLYEIVGEAPPEIPDTLSSSLSTPPKDAAARARKEINFLVSEQIGLKAADRDNVPKTLRTKLERKGTLVLKNSSLRKLRARGICIYYPVLPIIIFTGEAPSAQSFTMAHELAHICLKQSAISGPPPPRSVTTSSSQRIEEWCNEFAAAFLIPEDILSGMFKRPSHPTSSIDDNTLIQLAGQFSVSRHAMLIRLVKLGYVDADYYWQTKRPQFIQEESEYVGGGRSKYYGSRYRASSGDLYTGLVLEAWSAGRITNHNAAEFMGIKNIVHLESIRDNFGM